MNKGTLPPPVFTKLESPAVIFLRKKMRFINDRIALLGLKPGDSVISKEDTGDKTFIFIEVRSNGGLKLKNPESGKFKYCTATVYFKGVLLFDNEKFKEHLRKGKRNPGSEIDWKTVEATLDLVVKEAQGVVKKFLHENTEWVGLACKGFEPPLKHYVEIKLDLRYRDSRRLSALVNGVPVYRTLLENELNIPVKFFEGFFDSLSKRGMALKPVFRYTESECTGVLWRITAIPGCFKK